MALLACLIGLAGPVCAAGDQPAALRIATATARENSRKELVYYVWDGGEGRWFPTAMGFAEAAAAMEIPLVQAGAPRLRWRAIGRSGWASDWRAAASQRVSGTMVPPPADHMIKSARAGESPLVIGADGSIDWPGVRVGADFVPSFLTLDLDGLRRVEWLVLRGQGDRNDSPPGFPRHFLVQSALGPAGPWYPVPSADFAYFPDPGANEVWIPLRGLLAGALRVVAPRANPLADGAYGWTIGGVRVLRGGKPRFMAEGIAPSSLAAWNNLWLNFGIAGNEVHQRFDPWWETDRPLDGGMVCIGSCEWLAWGAQKLSWLGDHPHARRLETYLAGNPVDEQGVLWAAAHSDKHLAHSIHFVNNAIYPMAVAHHFLMRREPAFLGKQDPKTGESVLSKARRAVECLLGPLGGRDGLLLLPGREYDGTPGSLGSNYWDFWLFGHRCAHTNAFFYESLRQMADLEEALGNGPRAAELRALRPKVKDAYNRTFWNDRTGRYAGWVDAGGNAHDFGFTCVNAMALAFGLADDDRAARVLAWLDGKRIVAGDDSTGGDIYAFGFAPRTNTRAARHAEQPPVNTWNGALDIQPGGNAAFGLQIQNGGAVFFVSYYDLHARRRHAGTDAAARRFAAIEAEFHKDQLRRDPSNNKGASDIVGILREFPESGLVPYFFIDGILGIEPAARGLHIAPQLPQALPTASVDPLHFAGREWSITASRKATNPVVAGSRVTVPAGGAWLLTPDGKVSRDD